MTITEQARVLAEAVRNGVVESAHLGHLVGLDERGAVAVAIGDPDARILPRSSLKPVQAVAMLRAGLDLDGELLALACASHSGEDAHLDGVRRILGGVGLDVSALRGTPGLPLGVEAARGHAGPTRLAGNCSGKHAAMLATCVAAGWDVESYLDPAHPVQRAVRSTVEDLTGDDPGTALVDGCGAPLFSSTLVGLARAFVRISGAAPGTSEGRVAAAVRAHPWWVGGTGRTVTQVIEGCPGLVAKDGAEGVFAAALPDGRAVAVKVLDGSTRPVPVVVVGALRRLGVTLPSLDETGGVAVLGHGVPVGEVRAV